MSRTPRKSQVELALQAEVDRIQRSITTVRERVRMLKAQEEILIATQDNIVMEINELVRVQGRRKGAKAT